LVVSIQKRKESNEDRDIIRHRKASQRVFGRVPAFLGGKGRAREAVINCMLDSRVQQGKAKKTLGMAYYIEKQKEIDLIVICATECSQNAMMEYGRRVGIKEIQRTCTFSIGTRDNPKAKQQAMNIIGKMNRFEEAYNRARHRVRSRDFTKVLETMIKYRILRAWVDTNDQRTVFDSEPEGIDTFRVEYKGWKELKKDLDEHRKETETVN